MSDIENNSNNKGFKGLQNLSAKSPKHQIDIPVSTDLEGDASISSTVQTKSDQRHSETLSKSQTAIPPGRIWIVSSIVIGGILLLIFWVGQPSSNVSAPMPESNVSPTPDTTSNQLSTAVEEQPDSPSPFVLMPPVGNGLIFTSEQIRYCVYEDRRIKSADKFVDSYNEKSVSTFNSMVEDYNSRCGYFRYRAGALDAIEWEANQIQSKLETEGRMRMRIQN